MTGHSSSFENISRLIFGCRVCVMDKKQFDEMEEYYLGESLSNRLKFEGAHVAWKIGLGDGGWDG